MNDLLFWFYVSFTIMLILFWLNTRAVILRSIAIGHFLVVNICRVIPWELNNTILSSFKVQFETNKRITRKRKIFDIQKSKKKFGCIILEATFSPTDSRVIIHKIFNFRGTLIDFGSLTNVHIFFYTNMYLLTFNKIYFTNYVEDFL